MKPYTYLIKHLQTNTFYYGVKYASNADPDMFWKTYFTSSNKVKALIEQYGKDSFTYEIRKVFDNVESARKWESTVLRRMKVINRLDFLNKTVPGENFGFPQGEKNPMSDPETLKRNHENMRTTMLKRYGVSSNWKTKEHAENMSKRISALNSKQIECPNCHKVGGFVNMRRYHFDNCKIKGEIL